MLYKRYPKDLVLADGCEVTLFPLEVGHFQALRSFYEQIPKEERFFLKEDPLEEGLYELWIKNQERLRAWNVVAMAEGAIVGHSCLIRRNYGIRRHVGKVKVILSTYFRGKGLGTWMLLDLIKRAMELEIERLVAEIPKGMDPRIVDTLRRLDFTEVAVFKDFCKDMAGGSLDLIFMVKNLHTHWGDF